MIQTPIFNFLIVFLNNVLKSYDHTRLLSLEDTKALTAIVARPHVNVNLKLLD